MQRTISTCCRLPGSHTSTQSAPSGFPGGSMAKNLPAKAGDGVRSLGREGLLEKGMATHSSTLAWEILVGCSPWGRREPDTAEQLSNNRAASCQPWAGASAPRGGRCDGPRRPSGSSAHGSALLHPGPLPGSGTRWQPRRPGLVHASLSFLPPPSHGFPWGLCPAFSLQGP